MSSSILWPKPWTVDEIKPQLHAYRRGKTHPLIIPSEIAPEATAQLLLHNDFLSVSRLTFVTHGFRNTVQIPWINKMKDELLKESDQTVILVDWGNGADLIAPRYLQAGANIQTVGIWLGDYLIPISNLKPSLTIWGIGHSLGCHLLGLAGRHSNKFSRISAMDPAGPAFEKHQFLPYRLCSTDAKMVDVIHTDGYDSFLDPEDWISPVNHYGTLIPLGTIDFYPNFGYDQPGAGPVSSLGIAGSHLRAIDLYIWSIGNPQQFATELILDGTPAFESPVTKTRKADVPVEMGYHAYLSPIQNGPQYYIQTNKAEPWVDTSLIQSHSVGNGSINECTLTTDDVQVLEVSSYTSSCIIS